MWMVATILDSTALDKICKVRAKKLRFRFCLEYGWLGLLELKYPKQV